MKKLFIALCAMLTSAAAMQAQTVKLGHIDRQALMLMLPERAAAEAKMKDFAAQLDTRLKAMGTEYQTKVADAQKAAETMTQTQKDAAVRDIQEMEQRIQAAQESAKEDLAKQEEELLAPMIEKTNKAIKDVATENTFTYILDVSTGLVLFYDNGVDILPLVKKKLSIQ